MHRTGAISLSVLVTLVPATVLAQPMPPHEAQDMTVHKKSHPLLRHSANPAVAPRARPQRSKAVAQKRAREEEEIDKGNAQMRRARIQQRHLCTTKDRADLKLGKEIPASHALACQRN